MNPIHPLSRKEVEKDGIDVISNVFSLSPCFYWSVQPNLTFLKFCGFYPSCSDFEKIDFTLDGLIIYLASYCVYFFKKI
jgi:hypothetical protein